MSNIANVERVVAAAMKVGEAYYGSGGYTVTETIDELDKALVQYHSPVKQYCSSWCDLKAGWTPPTLLPCARCKALQDNDPKGAYARLESHLDEHYYTGARDDLREVAAGPLLLERAYWREPVAVLTGIVWLVAGFAAGCAVGVLS